MSTSRNNQEPFSAEISVWPDRLERAISGTIFDRVRVVSECDSTQDVARELGIGSVVTTARQVAGRGRPGNDWQHGEGAGVALSVVVEARNPAILSTASVLAVLDALDIITGSQSFMGAKFPNDVIHPDGRKLAGVLIEGDVLQSVIGIGVNVYASAATAGLGAVSMEEIGLISTRIEVMETLIACLVKRLHASQEELSREFSMRHLLLGGQVEVVIGGRNIQGVLVSADPFGELMIESSEGMISIPAAQARLRGWSLPSA